MTVSGTSDVAGPTVIFKSPFLTAGEIEAGISSLISGSGTKGILMFKSTPTSTLATSSSKVPVIVVTPVESSENLKFFIWSEALVQSVTGESLVSNAGASVAAPTLRSILMQATASCLPLVIFTVPVTSTPPGSGIFGRFTGPTETVVWPEATPGLYVKGDDTFTGSLMMPRALTFKSILALPPARASSKSPSMLKEKGWPSTGGSGERVILTLEKWSPAAPQLETDCACEPPTSARTAA